MHDDYHLPLSSLSSSSSFYRALEYNNAYSLNFSLVPLLLYAYILYTCLEYSMLIRTQRSTNTVPRRGIVVLHLLYNLKAFFFGDF